MKNKFLQIAFLLAAISLFLFACEEGPDYKDYSTYYPEAIATGMSPVTGYPTTNLTITGKSFGDLKGAVKVWFGGIQAKTIVSVADDQIVVQVPADAVTGKVTLQVWTHTLDSIGSYTVIPAPKISNVDPLRCMPGDVITIIGENFGSDANSIDVFIGDAEAQINSISDNEIKVTVPDTGSGVLTLRMEGLDVTGPFILVGSELLTSDKLIGHSGSWGNNPATFIAAAVDGDIATFVDGPSATGYVGYDFGAGKAATVSSVRYVPRKSHPARMINGEIRGANDPTLYDAVTLYKITEQPPVEVYTEVAISTEEAYRYIYYYSPDGYCNIAEIEFWGSIVDVVAPEGKYVFEFDDPTSTSWLPQQNATYVIESGMLKVTFDPVQFAGTSKRRADLKYMNTPWIYTSEYPILAIKFTKPEVVAFRPDITGLDSGFSNNDYKKDFEAQNVYYWDLSEKTASDRVECGVFQFKIPDITSPEPGYDVYWVRTFKTKAELQAFIGQ
ncbi:IPT/TIG domain-containing protein [Gaoshiqia sp. Z1-71]|uniref:IPT/TIG domain-containing protein n=1 Tax=Gaoshiqia hydrogeniformans TaxID=3290090 RepID=UPI003BF7955D